MSEFASALLTRFQDLVGFSSSSAQHALRIGGSLVGQNSGAGSTPLLGGHISCPQSVQNFQDRKLIEKCYGLMEAVLKLCQQPRLNLRNSPPFILDILPDIFSVLNRIFTECPTILQDNLYLRLFISNLVLKCKQTIRLFKEQKDSIYQDGTLARRNLNLKSLVFSHMWMELKAEFPDGKFIGTRFRITKRQAAEFWSSSFMDRTIVPWEEFRNQFGRFHKIGIGIETHALKNTIDLTCNDHISNFEFDVFTRLFHPWNTLLKNWQLLAVTHPAYVAFMTYDEVRQRLQQFVGKPGSYMFRLSCTRLGQWAIGYVASDHKIYQTIPQNKSLIQALVDGARDGFYLFPNGRTGNPDLSNAIAQSANAVSETNRVHVSPEQYQIYCEMGTTFEMCKICDERNKNVKLEPCEHLLCRTCLNQWMESAEGDRCCPFCRCEIKGTENVMLYGPSMSTSETTSNSAACPASPIQSPVPSEAPSFPINSSEKFKQIHANQPMNLSMKKRQKSSTTNLHRQNGCCFGSSTSFRKSKSDSQPNGGLDMEQQPSSPMPQTSPLLLLSFEDDAPFCPVSSPVASATTLPNAYQKQEPQKMSNTEQLVNGSAQIPPLIETNGVAPTSLLCSKPNVNDQPIVNSDGSSNIITTVGATASVRPQPPPRHRRYPQHNNHHQQQQIDNINSSSNGAPSLLGCEESTKIAFTAPKSNSKHEHESHWTVDRCQKLATNRNSTEETTMMTKMVSGLDQFDDFACIEFSLPSASQTQKY